MGDPHDSRNWTTGERTAGALFVAVEMQRRPTLARVVREAPLPKGVTVLLEIAAGDADALEYAQRMTGESSGALMGAACFFVEQVLFTRSADYYRVLGSTSGASVTELRRHMALLMRWLHPDTKNTAPNFGQVDRSVFVARITSAWQTLKSEERRAAYDSSLRAANAGGWLRRKSRPRRPLSLHRLDDGSFFGRLLGFFQGGR